MLLATAVTVALCAACVGTLLVPAAQAARAHFLGNAFGGPGAAAGQLALEPSTTPDTPGSGLAVNDATHDVYIADTGNHRVDEFSSTGTFIRAWGWGVRTGAAEPQTCTTTCLRGLSGANPGEFELASYVAVDNGETSPSRGDVYVGDATDNLVSKFDSEGNLIATWGNGGEKAAPNGQLAGSPTEEFDGGFPEQPLTGIAVDTAGSLWVFDSRGKLFDFSSGGTWTATCMLPSAGGTKVGGLAVATSGRLFYLAANKPAARLAPNCSSPEDLTPTAQRATGLAIDTFNNDLYVDQEGGLIEDIPGGCTPVESVCSATQVFGEGNLAGASGLAADPTSGTVYAANASTNQVVAFDLAIEATAAPATAVTAHTAALHAAVNPVGSELSRCSFEFGPTESYGSSLPCEESPASIGTGSSPVGVNAKVGGLEGGATYHFRLHATNGHGAVNSEDEQFSTPATAHIEAVTVAALTASSATLEALVNPESLEAHYHFEYGPCPSSGECASSPFPTTVPSEDQVIPAGSKPVKVSQSIEGLSGGTTYHFRIAVADANGLATSPEGTFVFEPSSPACASSRIESVVPLPDCRSYEMVTPTVKDGALINNGGFLTRPSIRDDGSRILMKSIQCFSSPESCVGVRQTEGEPYSFERGPAGWTVQPLAPPPTAGATMLRYSAAHGAVLYTIGAKPPALEEFVAREANGTLQAIGPISELAGLMVTELASGRVVPTSDLSHVLYQARGFFWPSLNGNPETGSVYEYSGRHQTVPRLVGVTGPAGSTSLIGTCGTSIGARIAAEHNTYGSLSADGTTAFITVNRCPSGGTGANAGVPVPADRVYARVEGTLGMQTILVSGPGSEAECGSECRAQPAEDAAFQGASTDASRVYFTSTQRLTDTATEDKRSADSATAPGCPRGTPAGTGCNLYEFECPNRCEDPLERHLVDVSAGDTSGLGPKVQGVVALSTDGSHVYFIARGTLTSSPNKAGKEPVAGADNLYAYQSGHGGSGGHLTFVAALPGADSRLWVENEGLGVANVTPDGRFLVFTSHRGLTPDANAGEGPAQVYRYDSQTEEITRLSIGTQGFNDNGNSAVGDARVARATNGFSSDGPARANPTMSDNGQVVFFESPTGLTPGALNSQTVIANPQILAENIYEWEAEGAKPSAGAPACGQPAGCLSLISDGRDLNEGSGSHENASTVQLLGTDTTGTNVFFWTADQLVPGDTDSQVDLYDARVDGGFPPAPPPQECLSGEECHGSPPPAPLFGSLPSNVFSGLGNAQSGTEGPPIPPPPPRFTPAQQLAAALHACRRTGGPAIKSCERRARNRYNAQLLAIALKACRKKPKRERAACERRARSQHRPASGARRSAAPVRGPGNTRVLGR